MTTAGGTLAQAAVELIMETGKVEPELEKTLRDAATKAGRAGTKAGKKFGDGLADGIEQGVEEGLKAGEKGAGEKGRKAGAQFGGRFGQAARRSIESALDSIPDAKVDADTSPAQRALAGLRGQLDELKNKKVGVDIDSTFLLAQVDRIRQELDRLGDESPDIQVKVDTTFASAELDKFLSKARQTSGNVRVGVDADTGGALAGLAAVEGAKTAVGRDVTINVNADTGGAIAQLLAMHGASGLATGGMQGLISAGIALGPAIVPAAAAAVAALFAIGGAAIAGVAGLSVLVLAFSGVFDAVQTLGDAQRDAGKDAAKVAGQQLQIAGALDQVRSAEAGLANARANAADAAVRAGERIKDAQRGIITAQREASQQVEQALRRQDQAERTLESAQQAARAAQQSLTQARVDARRALEDLQARTVDGALSEKQAVLNLARAREKLGEVGRDKKASGLDRQQAQLDVELAAQRLKSQRTDNARLAAEKADADKKGVAGSKLVTAAEQARIEAINRVKDAQRGLAEAGRAVDQARIEGAARVAAAQRQLTEAVRAQGEQQRQSAFAIAQAQQAVISAHRAVAQASNQAGASGSAAADKLKEKMDALGPAGQAFALFLFSLKPLFDQLKASAESGLLPGVQAGIKALLPLFPLFNKFVGDMSKILGDLFAQAGKTFTSPFWRSFFEYLARSAGPTLEVMAKVGLNLATAFATLLMAFEPVQKQMGAGLVALTQRFVDFITEVVESQGFQDFIDYVLRNGPKFVKVFLDLAVVTLKLLVALAPLGEVLLDATLAVTQFLAKLSPGQLIGIAAAIGAIGAALILAFGGPVLAVVAGAVAVAGAAQYAASKVVGFKERIASGFKDLKIVFSDVWQTVQGILLDFGITAESVKSAIGAYFTFIASMFQNMAAGIQVAWFVVIKPVVKDLAAGFLYLWKEVLSPFVDFLAARVSGLGDSLSGSLGGLRSFINSTAGAAELHTARLRQSEKDLAAAIRDGKQAQMDLTQARRDAFVALQDLNRQVQDGALSERQAILSVKQAKKDLDATKADPQADQLQREQAQLTYDQAVQSLKNVQTENEKLKTKKAEADKAGIDGSKQVVEAQKKVEESAKAIKQAEADLEAKRTAQIEQNKQRSSGFGEYLKGVYNDTIRPVWEGIKNVIGNAWNLIRTVFGLIKFHLDNFVSPAFRVLYENVIKPVWTGIQLAISIAWAFIRVIFTVIQINLKILGAGFMFLWRNVIKPVWEGIKGTISFVWEKGIKPVLMAVGGFIGSHVVPAFKAGVAAIGRIWSTVQDAAKKPVRFVIDTVLNKGLLGAFNFVASKFLGKGFKPIKITLPRGFASGGIYPGYTPGKDIGYIGVSGGESIMRPEVTRAWGPEFTHGANAAARSGGVSGARKFLAHRTGGYLGGFFDGGVVGLLASPGKFIEGKINDGIESMERQFGNSAFVNLVSQIPLKLIGAAVDKVQSLINVFDGPDPGGPNLSGGPGGSSYKTLIAVMRKSGIPFTVSSTYRPGANDYHGRGMAVDSYSSASNMARMASWLYRFSPYLIELIHSRTFGIGPGWYVKHGRRVGPSFYRNAGDHSDHVHAAASNAALARLLPQLANGGIFDRPLVARLAESGRETVIPLTRPRRAVKLARDSGLVDLLIREGALGGKGTVNHNQFTIPVSTNASDPEIVAHQVTRAVSRAVRATA